jgi:hypothetical protein
MVKALGGKTKTILSAIVTWDLTRMIESMDTESSFGSQATSTKVTTSTMRGTAMVKCISQMVLFIRGIGQEVFRMVKQQLLTQMALVRKVTSRTTSTMETIVQEALRSHLTLAELLLIPR